MSEYRPPDFNETYGYPPDYAESTGIFECDSEGKSVLDDFGGGTASFLGSTSMFGSSMFNSRNDMRKVVKQLKRNTPRLVSPCRIWCDAVQH